MTQIEASGRPQKDIRFQIGADNYEKQVSAVEWPGTQQTASWHGGTPDAIVTDVTEGDPVCNITCIQAWDDPTSLVRFMFEHAGEQATVGYKPHGDDTFELTATITIMRPTVGGKTNQFNEATIACPSTIPVVKPAA
jgi:hypothetical protein